MAANKGAGDGFGGATERCSLACGAAVAGEMNYHAAVTAITAGRLLVGLSWDGWLTLRTMCWYPSGRRSMGPGEDIRIDLSPAAAPHETLSRGTKGRRGVHFPQNGHI